MKIEIEDKINKELILKGLEKCPKLVDFNKKRYSISKLKPYLTVELKRDLFIIVTLLAVYILMVILSIIDHTELILIYLFYFPLELILLALPSIIRINDFKKKFSVVEFITNQNIK